MKCLHEFNVSTSIPSVIRKLSLIIKILYPITNGICIFPSQRPKPRKMATNSEIYINWVIDRYEYYYVHIVNIFVFQYFDT